MSRKIRVHTIEPGAHYQIHEVVDGRQEGGAEVYGDARAASKQARTLAHGAPVEWVKSGSARTNKTPGVTRKHRSNPKSRGSRLPTGAPNNAYHRVQRVGATKFELDGRVYDISKSAALNSLSDKIGWPKRLTDLKRELMEM